MAAAAAVAAAGEAAGALRSPAPPVAGYGPSFRVWHPRRSISEQLSHVSATTGSYSSTTGAMRKSSLLLSAQADIFLPSFEADAPLASSRGLTACLAKLNLNVTDSRSAGYLVQGQNDFGRYSNNRIAQLEMILLSLLTNRTLVLSDLKHCKNEYVDDLVDFPTLNRLLPSDSHRFTRLNSTCQAAPSMLPHLDDTVYPFTSTTSPWEISGVSFFKQSASDVVSYVGGGNVHYNLSHMLAFMKRPVPCVGLVGAFMINPHVGADPPLYDELHRAAVRHLRPKESVLLQASLFLRRLGLEAPSTSFVGVHLRLTDLGQRGFRASDGCGYNMTDLIITIRAACTRLGSDHILVATDNTTSGCFTMLTPAFPRLVLVSSGLWEASSCKESQFVQEVLAMADEFVGMGSSTFSILSANLRRDIHGKTTPARWYHLTSRNPSSNPRALGWMRRVGLVDDTVSL